MLNIEAGKRFEKGHQVIEVIDTGEGLQIESYTIDGSDEAVKTKPLKSSSREEERVLRGHNRQWIDTTPSSKQTI